MLAPLAINAAAVLAPAALMGASLLLSLRSAPADAQPWRAFLPLSLLALAASLLAAWQGLHGQQWRPWLISTPLGAILAVLVQFLGTVIGAFSARHLQGEPGQARYVAGLAGVLAAVHLLLVADHWLLLIGAWALVGTALQQLLCFYPDRPFARLAAHKKRVADRLADALLIVAALLAWHEVGSGCLSDLTAYAGQHGATPMLQGCALCLALAVILRTALLPVHGWLIQVMEAPTPVSALLHAGVVNLGGFVLIRFAPLLEQAAAARWLLIVFGLGTAVLAGLVMLTRITIKVRLAWSTAAQMGFMVLECGLGLYTLAALHLIGHSLYKAHNFLSASTVVRHTRLQMMRGDVPVHPASLLLAPLAGFLVLYGMQAGSGHAAWPGWWTAMLALAWAPLLWLPHREPATRGFRLQIPAGLAMIAGLGAAALLIHGLPLGLHDTPDPASGALALLGLTALYLCQALLQWRPASLAGWRRWSHAGFHIDEYYTQLALRLWPAHWTAPAPRTVRPAMHAWAAPANSQ